MDVPFADSRDVPDTRPSRRQGAHDRPFKGLWAGRRPCDVPDRTWVLHEGKTSARRPRAVAAVRKRRYDLAHIEAIVREVEAGATVEQVTRKHGISPATYFRWRKLVRADTVPSLLEITALREENSRLQVLVAQLTREIDALRTVLSVKP
jgi:putative transposase